MFHEFNYGETSRTNILPMFRTQQTPMLPFVVTTMGDYFCDREYFTRRKGMETCLILYTIDGAGSVEYNGSKSLLQPGQLMILDCRNYQYYATCGEHWHLLWIHFAGKCAFDYTRLLHAHNPGPFFLGNRISFPDYYKKIAACISHSDLQAELDISLLLHRLLTELITLKKSEDFARKFKHHQKELEASISYLKEHLSDSLSVELLAERCHLSKYYYIKLFKTYTGQTPYDYLLHIRLQKSQKLLAETVMPIGEIATETGFGDSKNYISCFKKKFGITPLQFRKQHSLLL